MASSLVHRTARRCGAAIGSALTPRSLMREEVLGRVIASAGHHQQRGLMVFSARPSVASGWRRALPASSCAFSANAGKLGPMNGDIRARRVQVVGDDGKMRRDVPLAEALAEARRLGVDLVQVAEARGEVICRLFDVQKRLFNLRKAAKNKPKQDKEVVFGVKIEAHDIQVKAAHVRGFLSKGHKVKVTVKFGKEFHLLAKAEAQFVLIQEAIGTDAGHADHAPRQQFGGLYVHYVPKTK